MSGDLKEKVHDFWNSQTCGTWFVDKKKFTKEYYEDIEEFRYKTQPEIFSFAQFPRYYGKKLLEVGVGAGTDFVQWLRSGALGYGIDLTQEAIDHVQHRLDLYGLKAQEIKVSDCENLSYPDNFFDIVYSWGVIHHTPNTIKALSEIIRVLHSGGSAKIMIYNRHSLLTYFFWVKHALLKGKPFRSLRYVLHHFMESEGTKGYTIKEMEKILENYPVKNVKVSSIYCYYDRLERFNKLFQFISRCCANILGREKIGWFLTIEFDKK